MDHSTELVIKRSLSIWIISFLILSNFMLVTPASATTVAAIIFEKQFDSPVAWVDTNSAGTITFAALENGSIIAMSDNGTVLWNLMAHAGSGVAKIVSDDDGNIVWMDDEIVAQQVGYITSAGHAASVVGISTQVNDIDIAHNGSYYASFSNNTAGGFIRVYNPSGTIVYTYNTPTAMYLYKGKYDNQNELFVTTNKSNNSVLLFNISNYTGWLDMNPLKLTKNTTLTTLDTFPSRMSIVLGNSNTTTVGLTFLPNVTNPAAPNGTCNMTRKSNSEFWYNYTRCGHYFAFVNSSANYPNANLTNQSGMINLSYYNASTKIYNVTFKRMTNGNNVNVTMFYGLASYTNSITNNVEYVNDGVIHFANFTGSSTWAIPNYVQAVNVTVVGGGGGGGSGVYVSSGGTGGENGTPAETVSYVNIPVIYGTPNIIITIGTGGAGGGPVSDGSAGGTSYWNDSASYDAAGGSGGQSGDAPGANGEAGGDGYTNPAGYANSTAGSDSWYKTWSGGSCTQHAYSGGGIGYGYGSGGGGGAAEWGGSFTCGPAAGGAGENGYISVSYYINNIPRYNYGTAPNTRSNGTEKDVTIDSSVNYVSTFLMLAVNGTSLAVPRNGGTATVGGSTPSGSGGRVYAIQYTGTGFSISFNDTAAASGTSNTMASADTATFYIEGRGSETDIYELDSTLAGNYITGGTVNSVDIASSSGLWATAGGNDGKAYIFSKAETSSWIVYYQGATRASIRSVAITDLGDYVAVGRSDGRFEYISTQEDSTAENAFSAALFVNKGGAPYIGQAVLINEYSGNAIISNKTGTTDSNGKFVFTAYDGRTYVININTNEYTQTYMGSSQYPTVTVNIPVPVLTRPYVYASSFNDTDGVITSTYQDVNAANVNIKVYNTVNDTVISDRDYLGVTSVNDVVATGDPEGRFKTVFNFTRTTGARYQDTVYLQSTLFNRIPTGTSDQNTLFIYAVYTVMLMVISLAVGAASIKFGVVFLVALTFAGIIFGFLPWSLYTVGVATSAFIALLEVFRRHD